MTAPDYCAIGLFVIALLCLSVFVKRSSSLREYAIGSAQIPGPIVFAGLAATYIGPGYTLGFCTSGFESGFLFFFLALAFSLQTVVVGKFVIPRLNRYGNCLTVGDIIGSVHGERAQLVAGFISVILCTSFVALLARVAGTTLHFLIGVPPAIGVAFITVFGVGYSLMGGLRSVIAAEAFQFSIYSIVISTMLICLAVQSHQDWRLWEALGWLNTRQAVSNQSFLQLASTFGGFLLGETLIPPSVVRGLSAKGEKTATFSFVAAGVFSVVWFGIATALGVIGKSVLPAVGSQEIFWSLTFRVFPHFFIGLVVVAVFAIILSCQEAVLNAGSVSFAHDVWIRFRKSNFSDSEGLLLSRVSCIGVGLLANALALILPDSIIEGLLLIYSIWGSSVLPSLVFALLLPKPEPRAALPSMVSGMTAIIIWRFLLHDPYHVPALPIGLAISAVIYGLFTVRKTAPVREVVA